MWNLCRCSHALPAGFFGTLKYCELVGGNHAAVARCDDGLDTVALQLVHKIASRRVVVGQDA
jgi:hypothetical protein